MRLPLIDLCALIDEVARLDPEPKFVFQIYSYEYEVGSVRCALESCEGEYTLWVMDAPGISLYAEQFYDSPLEFIIEPPDREDLAVPFDIGD